MRRPANLILALMFVLLLVPMGTFAQSPPTGEELQRLIEECSQGRAGPFVEPPTFQRVGDGEWRCVASDGPGGANIGGFIAFALLWTALPMAIAAGVASSRGESVPLALVMTLLLGWIGFAIVLVGMKRSSASAREAFEPLFTGRASREPIADRLRTLEDLRTRGLITDEEYGKRRAEILAQT